MEESWLMEDVDVEAQMRELERLQQAHCDRLIAEELQGDPVAFDFPLEREGERDFAASSSHSSSTEVSRSVSGPSKGVVGQRDAQINADEQLALMMSLESSSLSSQTSSTHLEDAGPSTGRQAIPRKQTPPPAHQSTSYSALVSEEMAFHFPMSLSHHVSADPELEEDIFCTPLQSPSRSPPPSIPTLLAHTHISPPPLDLMSPLPPPLLHSSFSPSFVPYTSPCVPSATAGSSSNWSSSFSSSFLDSDQELARQLQEEEQSERERRQKLSDLDFHVAMNMVREESGETEASTSLVQRQQMEEERLTQSERDAQIARAFQEELERGGEGGGGRVIGQDDADLAQRLHEEQLAEALQRDTTRDEEIARQMSEQLNAAAQPLSASARPGEQLLAELPKWWTPCPNCPSDANRKYHLIDIPQGVNEWLSVTDPLTNAGFTVLRLQRMQNVQLYQRLQFEKRSMALGQEEGYSVNEKLLFHTSSAAVSVICSEGLDQRLSQKGRFGSGVYFR